MPVFSCQEQVGENTTSLCSFWVYLQAEHLSYGLLGGERNDSPADRIKISASASLTNKLWLNIGQAHFVSPAIGVQRDVVAAMAIDQHTT